MGRTRLALIAFPLLVALGACSSSSPSASAGAEATASPVPVSTPAASAPAASAPAAESSAPAESAPAASSGPTAVPTAIDPCQLVTSAEASQLVGVSFGAGKESTTEGNGRICTYGSSTLNVFTVLVAQAPDQATVDAAKQQALAGIQQALGQGLKVTELPNFADGAATMEGSATVGGTTVSARGIYVVKGLIFFAFSDVAVGKSAPSSAALQAQAQTSLGRLP